MDPVLAASAVSSYKNEVLQKSEHFFREKVFVGAFTQMRHLGRASGSQMTLKLCAELWRIIIFAFFTKKMRFDRFEKMPILRWDLGRSSGLPWRPNDP